MIPAYNEARRLPGTLAGISEYLAQTGQNAEVIVVDDGSGDGTVERIRRQPGHSLPPKVIAFEANRGKGAAVREGLLAATGRYILFMDADHSTPVSEVDKLLKVVRSKNGAPVVIGSRYLRPDSIKIRQPWYRVAISRFGNGLIRLVLLPNVKDTQCGFKLFRRDAAREIAGLLRMERFSFDMELLLIAKQLGYDVREVPVDWYDTPGTRLRPIKSTLQTFADLVRIRTNLWRGRYRRIVPAAETK